MRFRTGFNSVLKGSACRKGGDHTYVHIHLFIYIQYLNIYVKYTAVATTILTVLVYEVMQDFYHQQ